MNANLNALTILGNTQFNSQTVGNYLNEVATVTQAQAEYGGQLQLARLDGSIKRLEKRF